MLIYAKFRIIDNLNIFNVEAAKSLKYTLHMANFIDIL